MTNNTLDNFISQYSLSVRERELIEKFLLFVQTGEINSKDDPVKTKRREYMRVYRSKKTC
jgi:hypothetical protein